MNNRPKRLKAFLLIIGLLAASFLSRNYARSARNNAQRSSLTPNDFAGLIVMSGFRPIAVDLLWIRSEELARQRRYYELISIYELITTLDPYFEGAWVYNSFNLAYRLSMLEDEPEMRWRWTRKALTYAMDGMKKNPESDDLAFTIAWIYYNRIGNEQYMIKKVLQDRELNPEGMPVIELARIWAEKAYKIKPHVIHADWVLEFIYRNYTEHATDSQEKLKYLNKRLEIWKYVAEKKSHAFKKAMSKINEIESLISKIKKSN